MNLLILITTIIMAIVPYSAVKTTGTMMDMEHVVLYMQENRPFDHYYGKLRGVRGFNDRAAPLLKSGLPVWYQPVEKIPKTSILCGCD